MLLIAPISIDVRLTVSAAFTITAALATILHAYLYREAVKDRAAYLAQGLNGLGEEVSSALIRVERSRLIVLVMLVIAGLGATIGLTPGFGILRQAAWLIAGLPFITVYGSLRDLQSRKRQVVLAAQMVAKLRDPAKSEE
jgi:hypothetical protein